MVKKNNLDRYIKIMYNDNVRTETKQIKKGKQVMETTEKTLKEQLIEEYGEKVIALAQHLDLTLEIDETEFQLSPDEVFETEEEKQERIQELADERREAIDDIKSELENITEEYDNTFSYYREEYEVLTDSEADDRQEEELDNYIEECILPEIPEAYQNYFDEEAWKHDAKMDGRGHIISRYDGYECEEKVNDTWCYIYRQN